MTTVSSRLLAEFGKCLVSDCLTLNSILSLDLAIAIIKLIGPATAVQMDARVKRQQGTKYMKRSRRFLDASSLLGASTIKGSTTRQPAGRPYTNKRPPSDYFKTNILVDCMGFNPIGLRAAVEMCGVDRVVFGSDYGPVPYGIKEHVQIVGDVLPSAVEREQVFWKTSNRIFRLGLPGADSIALDRQPVLVS